MKQNWWKLLVVVALVVAVGVALAAKRQDGERARVTATEAPEKACACVTKAEDVGDRPAAVEEPAVQPAPTAPAKEATEAAPAKPQVSVKAEKAESAKPAPKSEKSPEPQVATAPAESKPVPSQLPRMIELGADKCIPCKMMQPIIEELRKEYKGKLQIDFIDVWKDSSAAEKWAIQSIPTQIFLDAKGKEIFRHTGFFPKEDILEVFRKHGVDLD